MTSATVVPAGRHLLVTLEAGVHPNRVSAFMHDWVGLAGVVDVVDLAAVSRATVDGWLRQPETAEKVTRRRRRAKVLA